MKFHTTLIEIYIKTNGNSRHNLTYLLLNLLTTFNLLTTLNFFQHLWRYPRQPWSWNPGCWAQSKDTGLWVGFLDLALLSWYADSNTEAMLALSNYNSSRTPITTSCSIEDGRRTARVNTRMKLRKIYLSKSKSSVIVRWRIYTIYPHYGSQQPGTKYKWIVGQRPEDYYRDLPNVLEVTHPANGQSAEFSDLT